MLRQHEFEIRVRYYETDAQGRVHHGSYLNYFETGRVELMRASGLSYRELEEQGIMLVVAEIRCRYVLPAFYDDVLRVTTTTLRAKGARIEQSYQIHRNNELLVEGNSTIACIDRQGNVRRLPDQLCFE